MKNTFFAFITLITALAVTSCQNEEDFAQQPTNRLMVINAVAEGIGTGVRATMAYKYDILWSKNDQIYVRNIADNTKNALFDLKTGEETTEGTFAYTSGSTFAQGDEVEAYYPASLVDKGNLVWPAEQTTETVVPMYCKETLKGTGTEDFSFASLGAVLQIVFNTKQENVTLKSITLKDDTNPLSGTFTVNGDGKAVMAANADAPGITYDLGETGKALGDGANYFNIAVPAGTYSGLSIIFTATDESTCTLKGNVTINHNTVGKLTLTGKEFKSAFPFGQGEEAAEGIGKVRWVQLWDGGPKFAEYNIGATSVTDYGGYYCWGKTTNKDKNREYKSGLDDLTGDDDTATKLWGNKWRMPTKEELDSLLAKCDVKWDNTNKGLLCTGKGAYSSNSVFLPAAGIWQNGNVYGQGDGGLCWCSTPSDSSDAYVLAFNLVDQQVNYNNRDYGYSVRAVLKED